MCGIVGILDFSGASKKTQKGVVSEELVVQMRDTMELRGPDGGGFYVNASCTAGFGHRRLSIIDLATSANQPMRDEKENITLVFNGEIYNHAELREELTKLGVTDWKTDHSDTEVLLKAWQMWGRAALPKLRGMFGFAVWEENENRLTLVRDRVGVKPLYYATHEGKVTFGSEIKALLQAPWQKRAMNENGLFHYLSFLTVPAPETLFDSIFKLPAGHLIEFNGNDEAIIEQWWCPIKAAEEEAPTQDVDGEILAALKNAVDDRKVADVDVGVLLSGGVDSSTNVALFSNEGKTPVKTFCIGYDTDYESAPNEFAPAAEVAKRFSTIHTERRLTLKEVMDFLPKMIWLQDEPIADPVCVPVYFVSETARENGVTVAQVGEGADELFFGYRNWRAKWILQKIVNLTPRCIFKAATSILEKQGKGHTRLHEPLRRAAEGQPVFWGGVDIFTEYEKAKLLSPRLQEQFKGQTSWDAIAPYYAHYAKTPLKRRAKLAGWMTFIDLKLRLPELLLMRLDKMCMGVSLEGRVPFLDHRLVAKALSLPERQRMHPKKLKPVLKRIAGNFLPHHIIHRRKQGFALPVHEWFFKELGETAEKALQEFIQETDVLNQEAVDAVLAREDHQKAWYLLNLALWWQQYIKPKTAPRSAPKVL